MNKFYRSYDDKVIAGVCSGIANYFNINALPLRILCVIFSNVTLPIYLILWLIIPYDK